MAHAARTCIHTSKYQYKNIPHLRECNVRRVVCPQVSDHRVFKGGPTLLQRGHGHLRIPPELFQSSDDKILLRLEIDADIRQEIPKRFLAYKSTHDATSHRVVYYGLVVFSEARVANAHHLRRMSALCAQVLMNGFRRQTINHTRRTCP